MFCNILSGNGWLAPRMVTLKARDGMDSRLSRCDHRMQLAVDARGVVQQGLGANSGSKKWAFIAFYLLFHYVLASKNLQHHRDAKGKCVIASHLV